MNVKTHEVSQLTIFEKILKIEILKLLKRRRKCCPKENILKHINLKQ